MKFQLPSSLMVGALMLAVISSSNITPTGAVVDTGDKIVFDEEGQLQNLATAKASAKGGSKGHSRDDPPPDDGDEPPGDGDDQDDGDDGGDDGDGGGDDGGGDGPAEKEPPPPQVASPPEKKDLNEEVEIIVKYKDAQAKDEIKVESVYGDLNADYPELNVATMTVKRKDLGKIIHNENVESCDMSYPVYALGWPDEDQPVEGDTSYLRGKNNTRHRKLAENTPYGITMVQANHQTFLSRSRRSTSIKVCVVDTGFDVNHEDLAPKNNGQPVRGFSPYSGQSWSSDGHGHGTHCAGTIGAAGYNGKGVTSCNPKVNEFSFYIGKGLTDSGSGSTNGVMGAVQACASAGAKIISMSLGGGPYSSTNNGIFEQLYNQGILIVAAAGNDGNSDKSYPASYPVVMSVAAVDSSWNRASFSQYNDQVEIAAPGKSVLSTLPGNNYASWSGTSMATPHVAGVAALVWSYFPECSNNQIRNALLRSARDRGSNGCDSQYGWGVIQAKAAYDLLDQLGCEGAGGRDSSRKSDNAPGGCQQGRSTGPAPAPAPAPTPVTCSNNEELIKITLTTDAYPQENSWEILESDGSVFRSGSNLQPSTTHILMNECVRKGKICKFKIHDSFGDGICCGFGGGNYKVERDGNLIASGGEFGSTETVSICSNAPPDTPRPTPAPVAPPPLSCSGNQDKIKITLKTDAYPSENRWEVRDKDNDVYKSGNNLQPNTEHILMEECVPKNEICTFNIFDSFGDGLCCRFGEGSYTVEKNGRRVGQGAQFTNEESVYFCDGTPPAPPSDCADNEVSLTVELTTDKFPGETTWVVFDEDSGDVEASGGPYTEKETLHTVTSCIPRDTCLFKIMDSQNDGICCGQYGDGHYKLIRDGTVVADKDGTFGSSETINICGGSVPPTQPPPFQCTGSDEMIVQLTLVTDRNPDETTWSLKDWQTSEQLGSGGPYSERAYQDEQQFCVKKHGCYVFAMNDSGRDGLTRGNDGRYDLSILNGNVLVSNGGDFDASSEYTLFGSCTS